MVKGSLVIGKNIVALCISKENQLLGFFITIPKHSGIHDVHFLIYTDLGKVLDTYKPEKLILKKPFPADKVPPIFYGEAYGIIKTVAQEKNLPIQEIDIRDVYKDLGLPIKREALHKRFGRKTILFPNLYEKAMDTSLTKADKFALVEAIALLETKEGVK